MYLTLHNLCLYQNILKDGRRGLLEETVKRINVLNSSGLEMEPRWKNYQRWIFNVSKSFLSCLIFYICEIAFQWHI